MTLVKRVCIAAVVAAISAVPLAAQAQSAEAEALFRDGRTLIKHGKLAAGCDKLDASERLESSVGTLLNLGDCREKLGKLASAWAAFRKAEAVAKRSGGDDKRQAEAGRRAAQLEPRLSNLVVEVPARVDGLIVKRDGEVVDPATWSAALPVDPGTYVMTADAPGYRPWRLQVTVGPDGKRQVVTVPGLERLPPPPPTVAAAPVEPAPAPVAAAPVPVASRPQLVIERSTWSATRKFSAIVALAGAGALGTGVYYGVHSKDLQDRADQRCPTSECSDAEGLKLNSQARNEAQRANILYIAGGSALAASVVLWLVGGPSETMVVPTASSHQFGLSITGSL